MNIDIINVGRYRATSHGGRSFDLFNREEDQVYTITKHEFLSIAEQRSVEICDLVERTALSRVVCPRGWDVVG